MRGSIRAIVEKHNGERRQLLAILREVQQTWRSVPAEAITVIAEEMDLPRVHVEGTATFYHFLSREHRGDTTIYLNTSATSEMAGCADVAAAFEEAVGTPFGSTTADRRIGLYTTSCIGMSDQEPAALINDVVFTRLTPARVHHLVAGIKAGRAVADLVGAARRRTERVTRDPGRGLEPYPASRPRLFRAVRARCGARQRAGVPPRST